MNGTIDREPFDPDDLPRTPDPTHQELCVAAKGSEITHPAFWSLPLLRMYDAHTPELLLALWALYKQHQFTGEPDVDRIDGILRELKKKARAEAPAPG